MTKITSKVFFRVLASLSSALFLHACSTPAAYGPSSEERLQMAVGNDTGDPGTINVQDLVAIQRDSCTPLSQRVSDLVAPPVFDPLSEEFDPDDVTDNPEENHLAELAGMVRELRGRRDRISSIIERNTDLRFFSGTAEDHRQYDVPQIVQECNTLVEQSEIALDSFIRDILSMPIVSRMERRGRQVRSVPQKRVDFAVLAAAIELLAPFDASALMGRVESARSRYETELEASQRPARAPRRRR